jgi:two-component system response regulator FixJ
VDQLDRLRREGGGLPVIVTGIDEGTGLATRALRAGATAFLDMPFGAATLLSAIAAARREPGSRSVPDAVAEAVGKIGTLSRRERQVLAALAAGWRRREIAADLGISVRTVEVHQTRMLRRLRLARAAEAVRVYLLAGLAPSSARPPARSAGSRSPGAA